MNVLPVKGSDESLVQLGQNIVGEFIAMAFDLLNGINSFFHVPVAGK